MDVQLMFDRYMTHQQAVSTKHAAQEMKSVLSKLDCSSTILSSLQLRVEGVEGNSSRLVDTMQTREDGLTSRMHDLTIGVNKLLSSNISVTMNSVSQSHNMQSPSAERSTLMLHESETLRQFEATPIGLRMLPHETQAS